MPALILAPMQGMTDAPMRAFLSEQGGWTFAVAEFLRVSSHAPAPEIFRRHVPELKAGGRTGAGLPVQVQLLGGEAELMAQAAAHAVEAGAQAVDINFGCPAKTVNRHDGGATLLKYPARIKEIVSAVRAAVPTDLPVSAKIRLGWDSTDLLLEIADMAAAGGASWLTIHGRTRAQGYAPPAYWNPIGEVQARLPIPVVANGDLWTVEDLRRCRAETGCRHFMLGRGAVADPTLARRCAVELGIAPASPGDAERVGDWGPPLRRLACLTERIEGRMSPRIVCRWKQWLKLAEQHGGFTDFEAVKRAETMEDVLAALREQLAGGRGVENPSLG